MDKHYSLLRKFVDYGRKKFYNIGPWANFGCRGLCYKTLYARKSFLSE